LVFDLLTLGYRRASVSNIPPTMSVAMAGVPSRWGRWLTGWETGLWLLAMWVFGGIITLGLLSFNLEAVREGSAIFPYTMASIGYPGLLLVTLFFVWRFLSSLEARGRISVAGAPAALPALPSTI
jgi:nitric oxide reductase subunit B